MASRELAAFMTAVTRVFGSEQARRAAEDWLDGLLAMLSLPAPTICSCRQITIAVAVRLAARVSASPRQILSGVCHDFTVYSETNVNENLVETVRPAMSDTGACLS